MRSVLLASFFVCVSATASAQKADFVNAATFAPTIYYDMRYVSGNNVTGMPVVGYENAICLLHQQAAQALAKAQQHARQQGLSLKVFDCYRPKRAAEYLVNWLKKHETNTLGMKRPFNLAQQKILKNYLVAKSDHSRGATVDLTLVKNTTGKALDMGSAFGLYNLQGSGDSVPISSTQRANRELLKKIMRQAGFAPYSLKWWHFSLRSEPYPNTYFDFVVKE